MGADPPRNPHERGNERQDCSGLDLEVSMTVRSNDAAIDEIVASCSGDLRGAVRALLLINEHLEAELAKLYAAAADQSLVERGDNVLH
jgi:hypothetical protein